MQILPGFEVRLWQVLEKLRGTMEVSEVKHIVLGLIFLKYISDVFEEKQSKLTSEGTNKSDPENPIEYQANNVFWVPKIARWPYIQAQAKKTDIGKLIDEAMTSVEENNKKLIGVLPNHYAQPGLNKCLEELIDVIASINRGDMSQGFKKNLSQVYDYFLSQFAIVEGKKGGEFYTPHSIGILVVEMLAPYKGRIFDPCCGSGGMLVQGWKFIEEHGGKTGDISIYGQELNHGVWRLAFMNLAIQGINANFDLKYGDSLRADLHPGLEADYILANPPFNVSNWGREELKNDQRWKYGLPPAHNANFAWVQHIIHHLAPRGLAGFIMSYNSMSSSQANEKEIRRNIIEADLIDCIVALPGQLFYSTQIPVCLWFLTRDKNNDCFRSRQGETLFIDARMMGTMINRVHRELTDEDISRIAAAYHAWRGDLNSRHAAHTPQLSSYTDIPGFCKSARLEGIRQNNYILTPGAYVGSVKVEADESFESKMKRLALQLKEQQKESFLLDEIINNTLQSLGFGE